MARRSVTNSPGGSGTCVDLEARAPSSRATTASAAAKRPGFVSWVGLSTSSVSGVLAFGRYQPSFLCVQPAAVSALLAPFRS